MDLRGYARLKRAVEAAEAAGQEPPPGWETVWRVRQQVWGGAEPPARAEGPDADMERVLLNQSSPLG